MYPSTRLLKNYLSHYLILHLGHVIPGQIKFVWGFFSFSLKLSLPLCSAFSVLCLYAGYLLMYFQKFQAFGAEIYILCKKKNHGPTAEACVEKAGSISATGRAGSRGHNSCEVSRGTGIRSIELNIHLAWMVGHT